MVPEILQHIERLQLALADADPTGRTAAVARAVAEIAAGLRGQAAKTEAGPLSNGPDRPAFM